MPPPIQDTPQGRFYFWKGARYVSVTTVIDRIPKEALQQWKLRKLLEDFRTHKEHVDDMTPAAALTYLTSLSETARLGSASTGTNVHRYLELVSTGQSPSLSNSEELAGFYQQVDQFIVDYRPNFIESEARVYSNQWGYAGTLDAIIEIGGKCYVMDAKSGKRVYPEVALQLAAYRNADFIGDPDGLERPLPDCSRVAGLVLHIRPDKYELRTVTIGPTVHGVFLSALEVYDWSRQDSGFVIGDRVPIYE